MSLINAYTQVLNESAGSKSQAVKGFSHKVGANIAGENKPAEKDPAENADLESPKEDKEHSVGGINDGVAKKAKEYKESTNPFDELYNKVLAQENWEADEEANEQPGTELNFIGDTQTGEGEAEASEEGEEGEEGEDPMVAVLDALKAAVAALEKVVGGEHEQEETEEEESEEHESPIGEEAEEGGSEEESSEEGGSEETTSEEVEAEILGHALVDLEKLAASLTSPKSQVVKGAVPVAKGKAQVPKGGKVDGKPSEFKGSVDKLEGKNNDTGYVKNGKNWLDQ